MQKLHSQLALFGAIDQEVTEAKARLRDPARTRDSVARDDEIISTVEGFLPGTTGFAQNGWYPELKMFLSTKVPRRHGGEDLDFPDLDQAIFNLTIRPTEEENDERDPVLARAVYAAVVLTKVYQKIRRTNANDPLDLLPRALINWPKTRENDPVEDLKNALDDIKNRQQWSPMVRYIVGDEFADSSRPCFGTLRKVDNQYCAYITTDSTDDTLTVKDIAKIVEPINWAACCKFFCDMRKQQDRVFTDDGWSRLVEQISGECDKYYLDTNLVFWKEQQEDGSLFINYDLDPDRGGTDSKLVEVDSGYIWITPLDPTGVRIRTSKLERVCGLSPTATSALACLLGWGDAGYEMLAGTAREYIKDPNRPPKMKPFLRSPRDQSAYKG